MRTCWQPAPFFGSLYDVFINAVARPSTATAPQYNGDVAPCSSTPSTLSSPASNDAETAFEELELDLEDLLGFDGPAVVPDQSLGEGASLPLPVFERASHQETGGTCRPVCFQAVQCGHNAVPQHVRLVAGPASSRLILRRILAMAAVNALPGSQQGEAMWRAERACQAGRTPGLSGCSCPPLSSCSPSPSIPGLGLLHQLDQSHVCQRHGTEVRRPGELSAAAEHDHSRAAAISGRGHWERPASIRRRAKPITRRRSRVLPREPRRYREVRSSACLAPSMSSAPRIGISSWRRRTPSSLPWDGASGNDAGLGHRAGGELPSSPGEA